MGTTIKAALNTLAVCLSLCLCRFYHNDSVKNPAAYSRYVSKDCRCVVAIRVKTEFEDGRVQSEGDGRG